MAAPTMAIFCRPREPAIRTARGSAQIPTSSKRTASGMTAAAYSATSGLSCARSFPGTRHSRQPDATARGHAKIFEAADADIADLGESMVTGCCACAAKEPRSSLPLAAASRAIDRAAGERQSGHILLNTRNAQIAARHADPRTTMRYGRTRKNLDRHPNYILAATWPPAPDQRASHPVQAAGD